MSACIGGKKVTPQCTVVVALTRIAVKPNFHYRCALRCVAWRETISASLYLSLRNGNKPSYDRGNPSYLLNCISSSSNFVRFRTMCGLRSLLIPLTRARN